MKDVVPLSHPIVLPSTDATDKAASEPLHILPPGPSEPLPIGHPSTPTEYCCVREVNGVGVFYARSGPTKWWLIANLPSSWPEAARSTQSARSSLDGPLGPVEKPGSILPLCTTEKSAIDTFSKWTS